jgi:hypothetical protein
VGFPCLGGRSQALGVPGVRHDPHLHGGGRGGLEPAGGDQLVRDGPASDDQRRAGAAARMASGMLIGCGAPLSSPAAVY